MIDAARRVSGREIKVITEGRRAGDPPRLLADSGKSKKTLGWAPQYAGLDTIIRHAWEWELLLCGED